jgi:release factor glutamine methyltransferase
VVTPASAKGAPGAPGGAVTWRWLWAETAVRLGGHAEARVHARWLCEEASGFRADEWSDALERPAAQRGLARLDAMIARRLAGEPLQYVLGSWDFRTVSLMVDRRVLIPRPETEQVVDVALERVRRRARPILAADLGTGSGAIALALAAELPVTGVTVWATEASRGALDVAAANLAGLGRRAANVRLAHGSWYDALPDEQRGQFDLVVSNPPYIATDDEVDPAVRQWEPDGALFAGADGLDALRLIIGDAPAWLAPGGWLVAEIGAAQGRAVVALARAAGLVEAEVRPDLSGRDRILAARRP